MADDDFLAKLLAKAEDSGSTPEERETFMNAVSRMAAKRGIELDMLRAKNNEEQGQKVNVPVSVTIDIGTKGDRGGGAYAALFLSIAEVYGVQLILSNSGSWVKAFGMQTDIDIVKALYDLLFPQMIVDCVEYIDSDKWRSSGTSIWDARYSFYSGWRNKVQQRLRSARMAELKRAKRKYAEQGQSTSVVMANKQREVNAMYWESAGRLKSWSVNSGSSSGSRNAGTQRGETARISSGGGSISS